ncbi:MAG: chorion class high-cysteine HCB protein 13 [Clostridiales bacterium]|nr:chorion class high-cysteine HCB protein 13 [Clostridiales bacterium]
MNFFGGDNNIVWILLLILIFDNDECGCGIGCDSIIWLLILSKFCCGERGGRRFGLGCGCRREEPCGCTCGCR